MRFPRPTTSDDSVMKYNSDTEIELVSVLFVYGEAVSLMSSIFHVLLAQRDDISYALTLVDKKISNFRAQNGTKEHPARSCREIKLDHPNFESGLYCFSFDTLLVLLTKSRNL